MSSQTFHKTMSCAFLEERILIQSEYDITYFGAVLRAGQADDALCGRARDHPADPEWKRRSDLN